MDHSSAMYHHANVVVASGVCVFSSKQCIIVYPDLLRILVVRQDCNYDVGSLQKLFFFVVKNPFNMYGLNDNVFV
jgi:hypothetical protein